MKRINFLSSLFIAVIFSSIAAATIINIPDDYTTIQAGIDASSDDDTVLVQPDIYYENINFNGHNIVLGSLFLTTGDTSYIERTVIDGDSGGTVVTFESGEDSTTFVFGFTIKKGVSRFGGGIKCTNSNPAIMHNKIIENSAVAGGWNESYGGGIYCQYGSPAIINNFIASNNASTFNPEYGWGYGGGICSRNSNSEISKNLIIGNSVIGWGGGICCLNGNSIITMNIIQRDTAFMAASGGGGGAISCFSSNSFIARNLIYYNVAIFGGGISCDNSAPLILNTVITENISATGGSICCLEDGSPQLINSLLWNNSQPEITFSWIYDPNSIHVSYSSVMGGENMIETNNNGTVYWLEGNIDLDPLFRDPDNGDFHLMAIECGDLYDSPCIDAGHPGIIDTLLSCDWGLGTERSDMGAYSGGEGAIGIDEPIVSIPTKTSLSQNYPNPFNVSTVIKYELPQQTQVTIDIYDILGRKVKTLVDKQQPAGYHQAIWRTDDFASGMYFYKLQAGEYSDTKKMLLLK